MGLTNCRTHFILGIPYMTLKVVAAYKVTICGHNWLKKKRSGRI